MTFWEIIAVIIGSSCLIIVGVVVFFAFREGIIRSKHDPIF